MAETATTLPPAQPAPRFDVKTVLTRYGAWIALALLILVNLAITPNFATWQTLNVNLTQVCTIVIVAVGMTLVIATGGVDLSVGSTMAIAAALAATRLDAAGAALAILAGIAALLTLNGGQAEALART